MLQTYENQLKRRTVELEILAAHGPELFTQDSIVDICTTAGKIIHEQLGYPCTIFDYIPDEWRLRYVSLPATAKAMARKLTGFDSENFVMPGEFELYRKLLHDPKALFFEESREFTLQGLQTAYSKLPEKQGFIAQGLEHVLNTIINQIMPALNHAVIVAPILAGGKLFGNITVFGKNLNIDDMPMVKHFAALVGMAIHLKMSEQALSDSERRYRTLFQNASEGILVADSNTGYFSYANTSACRMLGYSAEHLAHMTVRDIHPSSIPNNPSTLVAPQNGELSVSLQNIPCLCSSGATIYANVNITNTSIDGTDSIVYFYTDVTSHKNTELALSESEATARALINAPMDAAYLIDTKGFVIDCNNNGAQRLGCTREQLIQSFLLDYFPADVAKFREKAVKRVMETRQPLRMEDEREGIWNDTVIYPITDLRGEVSKIAILARDITVRKQTEVQLRTSEENFRSLSDEITDGVVVHIDGKCYWCNRAFTAIFGVTREEIIGKDLFHFIDEDSYHEATCEHASGGSEPAHYESRGTRADGVLIDVDVITKKITFDDNLATLVILRDITDKKSAEQALMKSERRYRSVVEDVDAMICRFKPDGTLTFVNEEYCVCFNTPRERLIGRKFFDFIPENEREGIKERYLSLTKDNPTVTYEHRVVTLDGHTRWQRWTDRAIFDEQGNFTEYQSIGFDTTDRRIAEERITALSRKVISSQEQERARLSRELHDEMGQQLSAIQLVLESMLSRPQPDRDYIELIAERIEDLTIEVRRICKGMRPVILDTFGFHMSLENLIHEFRDSFDMDIRYMPASKDKYPMPPQAAISTYRIAQEALTNALRHAGGARITVYLHADHDQVQLDIEDDGPGFDSSAGREAGLGLVGMRERAALCGADLIIDTAPGRGTRIILTVPIKHTIQQGEDA